MFIKSPFECGRSDESREQTFENVSRTGSACQAESEEGSAQVKQPEPLSVAAKEKADLRDSSLLTICGLVRTLNYQAHERKKHVCVWGGREVSDHLEM